MACYTCESSSNSVRVVRTENLESFTDYVIEVKIGGSVWFVRHRYSEFFELNEQLIADYKIDKKLLPPKKVFGNTSEAFIQKRRAGLELYLQNLLESFQQIPFPLAMFLDFQKYEINGVTQILAQTLFERGEAILENNSTCSMDPLQLHSITDRLMNPGGVDVGSSTRDMGHILDFVTRLEKLKVIGSDKFIQTSNISMNNLEFSFSMFKNLKYLELVRCNVSKIQGINVIRPQLHKLKLKKCIHSPKEFLNLNVVYWETETGAGPSTSSVNWPSLTWVDLSENNIGELDDSMNSLGKMEYLDLHDNYLESIDYLENISYMSHLDLSNNRIKQLNALHLRLGNIKSINLSGNSLDTLQAFNKLYSLEYLDVSNNQISQALELRYLGTLPLLNILILVGNPVTIIPDYRVQVLKIFEDRAKEIHLDNKLADEKELDTIAVLLALDHSKKPRKNGKAWPSTKKSSAQSVRSSEASTSRQPVDEDLTSFGTPPIRAVTDTSPIRSQVELLREQTGNKWLTMLESSPHSSDDGGLAKQLPLRFDSPFSSPDHSNVSDDGSYHSVTQTNSATDDDKIAASASRRLLTPENQSSQILDQTDRAPDSGESSPQTVHSIPSSASFEHAIVERSSAEEHTSETPVIAERKLQLNLTSNNSQLHQCEFPIDKPPDSLNVEKQGFTRSPYLSIDLMDHLGKCISVPHQQVQGCLSKLLSMDGEELLNFFYDKNTMQRVGDKSEELCHAMWTQLIHFYAPEQELSSLVLLSNQATYFLEERSGSLYIGCLRHADLKEVCIGLDQQSVRFRGDNHESIHCCLTRNPTVTQEFVTRLTFILDADFVTKDSAESEEEPSIYDPVENSHPSHVAFKDLGEDNSNILVDAISQSTGRLEVLVLSVCAHRIVENEELPVTLVLTNEVIAVLKENHVTFPLPEGVMPRCEQCQVQDTYHYGDVINKVIDTSQSRMTLTIKDGAGSIVQLDIKFPTERSTMYFRDELSSIQELYINACESE